MKYHARLEDMFLFSEEDQSFSFLAKFCTGARDGQDVEFLQLFDRFPENTTHVSYDDETNTGTYCINGGEEITEDGDLRCSHLKTMFDTQLVLVEHV